MVSQQNFIKTTNVVIDYLEGGYYHPNMLKDGRVTDSRYSASGETMFGLDRKAGAGLSIYPQWGEFWGIIDNANAANTWSWNYMGGAYKDQLKSLAGQIMYYEYSRLYYKYLSPESQSIVDSDPRLTFNFAYAAWNGEGWFNRFADVLNSAVADGATDKDTLVDLVVNARANSSNSLIAQGGAKIAQFINSLNSSTFFSAVGNFYKSNKKTINYTLAGIGVILLTVSVYFLKKKKVILSGS